MTLFLSRFFIVLQLLAFSLQVAHAGDVNYAYDAGPDPKTQMGRKLIDLNSRIPYFPGLSWEVMGSQKFRPAFGPMPWRMKQAPNSVKILFIGQDGTHIAEAAGRPATAGFGGRAQDLANYFGVDSSAAFINTYAFTIKGQYGAFSHPIVHKNPDGSYAKVSYESFVDNRLWLMSQDLDSPLVQWRNDLIDWIIENNKDSLKMIVLFGGAARDAASAYIISRGGKVGTRFNENDLKKISVPETELINAGGNNETPFPYDKEGKDLFAKVLGKSKINYKIPMGGTSAPEVVEAQKELSDNISKWGDQLVLSGGGIHGSGVVNPAQLGGYDIARKMEINGKKTISLKGLKVGGGSGNAGVKLKNDLLVVQFPHPTALSMMKPKEAAQKVGAAIAAFKPYVDNGWKIEADEGFENSYAKGEEYAYKRGDIGPETYDFGAPALRMINKSDAVRFSPSAIIIGTRNKVKFDEKKMNAMLKAKPSALPSNEDMWTTRAISPKTRYTFDPGPGEKYAKLMKENIPQDLIESHGVNRDYAHYRGTFVKPKAIILADPDGHDDLITSRALTGTRGQYLNGLMSDLGYGDQYLVIKTAPFGIDGEDDFNNIYESTHGYREKLLKQVLKDSKPAVLFTDGPYAQEAVKKIFGDKAPVKVVNIQRSGEVNEAGNNSGIVEAAKLLKKKASGAMKDIPRSHLTYYARMWEGTSGDRVIMSSDPKYAGKAFLEVAPDWAVKQKFVMSDADLYGISTLNKKLHDAGLRQGSESIPAFVKRIFAYVENWFETLLAA